MITLNQIIAQLESFSSLHAQVNGFGHGNTSQYKEENSSGKIGYPYVFANEIGANANISVLSGYFTYTIQLIFSDLVRKDRSNETEVKSDMTRIALDYINALRSPRYFDLNGKGFISRDVSFNLTYFTEDYQDRVSGCYFDLIIKTKIDLNECIIPIIDTSRPIAQIVKDWALQENVTDTNEISALNELYLDVKDLVDSKPNAELVLLMNVSPSSSSAALSPLIISPFMSLPFPGTVNWSPSLGHSFDGSNGLNLINTLKKSNTNARNTGEVLTAFTRTEPLSNTGHTFGFGDNAGTGYTGAIRETNSTIAELSIIEYPTQDLSSTGNYICYKKDDNSTFGVYKDGVFIEPTTPNYNNNEIVLGVGRFGYGFRTSGGGIGSNRSIQSLGCFIVIDDGGDTFTASECLSLNNSLEKYNNAIR